MVEGDSARSAAGDVGPVGGDQPGAPSSPEPDAARGGLRELEGASAPPLPHTTVRFAHNSELQFGKLLDFYGIVWEYEPRSFILEADREGRPTQAFTPDFYLPAYDLFIEITTMNQNLVTKKNRKARRLRELYPEVRIKVFYQRDYLALLVKYGLEPPSQEVVADESVEPLPLRFDDPESEADRGDQHGDRRGRKPA